MREGAARETCAESRSQLPAGSHVIFLPLADGLLLREILANRTHPIGVSYDDIYQYLICEGKAPCLGWMTR